ncbi:MAG TPA: hypothetical protein DIU37_06650 [Opitutae bacterium]|nr:hypothetical protein [Opitutae bacterium]|tara:strand:- start:2075 stop:2278 length:204 start_codon:yes stop_codon:yes gene_type:complete
MKTKNYHIKALKLSLIIFLPLIFVSELFSQQVLDFEELNLLYKKRVGINSGNIYFDDLGQKWLVKVP